MAHWARCKLFFRWVADSAFSLWECWLLGQFRRRQWHPTPILLPGKSHGRRSLVGCSPWGRWELDTTQRLHFHFSLSCIGEGNGNRLQCSRLENPRDGGAWWAAIYGVAQSQTRLKRPSSSSSSSSSSRWWCKWMWLEKMRVASHYSCCTHLFLGFCTFLSHSLKSQSACSVGGTFSFSTLLL